jgi:hypothetical protein
MNMSGVTPAERRGFFYAWGLAVLGATALIPPLALSADGVRAEQLAAKADTPTGAVGVETATSEKSAYSVRLIKQAEGKFKLRGQVASKEDHKAVLGLVKASYPSASVTDRMKIADGPRVDMKLGNISFALKVLGHLQAGSSACINEEGVALNGGTENRAVYAEVQSLIESGRPAGISIKDNITEPQKSFSWRAEVDDDKVKLTGAVPDTANKKELEGIVQKMFAGREIVDYTYVAEGAPESWLDAAMHSLKVLRLLNSGFVLLADQSIRVDGQATDGDTLKRIADLADRYPVGFALESKVSVEPARASLFGGFGFPQTSAVAHHPAVIEGEGEAVIEDSNLSTGAAATR